MAIIVTLGESRLFKCPLTYTADGPQMDCKARGVGDTVNCLWWTHVDRDKGTGYCGAGGEVKKGILEPPR
jgi:hypothetical protein